MLRKTPLAAAIAVIVASTAIADSTVVNGPMAFNPIAGSAYAELTTDPAILNSQPWTLPAGYTQRIVSDENNLNLYAGSDWNDMRHPCINGEIRRAGRRLWRQGHHSA